MRREVEKILARHGTDLTILSSGGEKTVRGFFRAVNSKSWQSVASGTSLLGEVSRDLYAYLGPADEEVREGDSVRMDGRVYLFRRVEPYWYAEEKIYVWGLCVEQGGDDAWGMRS